MAPVIQMPTFRMKLPLRIKPGSLGLLWLALTLMAISFSNAWLPLQRVHWDSPIYLYQAKRFAETRLIASYSNNANAIASQTQTGKLVIGEGYSEAYWRFTRLGHIALLGGIVKLFGSNETGVFAASLSYAFILAMAVLLAIIGGRALCQLYQPEEQPSHNLPRFILLTGFVCAFSGGYLYMAGNLVAEVPAFFGVSLGLWLSVNAIRYNSRLLAVASGFLAYVTFTVMMEAVWLYIALYLALWLAPTTTRSRKSVAASLLWAAVIALAGYVFHLTIFSDLAIPRTILSFHQHVAATVASRDASMFTPLGAAGLLWLALPFAILARWRAPLTRFTWIWFFLCLTPFLIKYFRGGVETRMFYLLTLPLILLFALGLSTLNQTQLVAKYRSRFLAGLMIVVLSGFSIAHPTTYALLHQSPGAWRLQHVRAFLWPPAYETLSYPLKDLRRIADWLYDKRQTGTLVVSQGVAQENLDLIRFFGPAYPADADLATQPDPTNLLPCGTHYSSPYEPVLYRGGSASVCCSGHPMNQVFILDYSRAVISYQAPALFTTSWFTVFPACVMKPQTTH